MTPEQAQELWTKPYERLVEWNGDTPPITFTHRLIKDFDTMQGWISAQEREIESLRTQLSDALKRAERAERAHKHLKRLADESAQEWTRDRELLQQARADLTRVAQERDDLGLQLATKTFEAQDAWDALARVTEDLAAERERTDWPGTERMELIERAIKAERELARVTGERDAYAAEADAISSELGGSPVERIVQDVRELQADLARMTEERNELRHALDEMSKHPDWVRGYAVGANAAQSRIQALEGMVGMLRGALDFLGVPTWADWLKSTADAPWEVEIDQAITRDQAEAVVRAFSLTESQAAEKG